MTRLKTGCKILDIDIETYSSVDIKKGVYKYTESDDFRILLCSYSMDEGPVITVDLTEENLPREFIDMLEDPQIIKRAHNASFERVCFSRYLYGKEKFLDPEQWHCTMALMNYLGLPPSLEKAGKALGLEEDQAKDSGGKALIRFFSLPSKRKGVERNLPSDDPKRWELYKRYNNQDVMTQIKLANKVKDVSVPQSEWAIYAMDQRMNDTGALLDMELVERIIEYKEEHTQALLQELQELTGLANPNSQSQMVQWLYEQGIDTDTINKTWVSETLKTCENKAVLRALSIRQELGKTSLKKYDTMRECACDDNRIRGVLQYYGANRTGRWAGRLVQVQNLPRNYLKELDSVRDVSKSGDFETIELVYESATDTLSQLIRTAFIPKEGCQFIVADYSAIEARVIAWMSGEKWRQDVFENGGDIYCASASQMFKVPVEKHGVNGHLRQKGKIAELALGYQGAVGALKAMGGDKMGLEESEMQSIVKQWRKASPHIVEMWKECESAARGALLGDRITHACHDRIAMRRRGSRLVVRLPSGRCISYQNARASQGSNKIEYKGVSQTSNKWVALDTYGGKLTENIVQATARDLLAGALIELEKEGYKAVFHIHDEVVLEVPKVEDMDAEYRKIVGIMCRPPKWAEGLKLNAEGFIGNYYMKD